MALGLDLTGDLAENRRVNDGIQVLQLFQVVKDNICQLGAVQLTVGVYNLAPKTAHDAVINDVAGLH